MLRENHYYGWLVSLVCHKNIKRDHEIRIRYVFCASMCCKPPTATILMYLFDIQMGLLRSRRLHLFEIFSPSPISYPFFQNSPCDFFIYVIEDFPLNIFILRMYAGPHKRAENFAFFGWKLICFLDGLLNFDTDFSGVSRGEEPVSDNCQVLIK